MRSRVNYPYAALSYCLFEALEFSYDFVVFRNYAIAGGSLSLVIDWIGRCFFGCGYFFAARGFVGVRGGKIAGTAIE